MHIAEFKFENQVAIKKIRSNDIFKNVPIFV